MWEAEVDQLDVHWCHLCGTIKGRLHVDSSGSPDPICCDLPMKPIWMRVDERNRFGEDVGDNVRMDVIRGF